MAKRRGKQAVNRSTTRGNAAQNRQGGVATTEEDASESDVSPQNTPQKAPRTNQYLQQQVPRMPGQNTNTAPPPIPVNGTQVVQPVATARTAGTTAASIQAAYALEHTTFTPILDKKAKDEADKKLKKMIDKIVNEHVFRLTKFIRFEGADKIAAKEVCILAEYYYLKGKSEEEQERLIDIWVEKYVKKVVSSINRRRGEIQQQLRKVFKARYHHGDGELPTSAQLESILKRSFAPDDETMMDLFMWWWDVVIPKVAGKDWAEDKRHYGIMSLHTFEEDNTKLFVPKSTEALAVWIVENNRKCWPEIWKGEDENPGLNPNGEELKCKKLMKKPDGTRYQPGEEFVKNEGFHRVFHGPKFQGLFTFANSGQGKMSSITQEGNSKFDECLTWAKQGRSKANFKLCIELECKVLHQLRVNAGIVDGSRDAHKKRKRCKNTNVREQKDMIHNDFAEDEVANDGSFALDLNNLIGNFSQTQQVVPPAAAAATSEHEEDGSDESEN